MPENKDPKFEDENLTGKPTQQSEGRGEAGGTQKQPIGEPNSISDGQDESARQDRMHRQDDQPGLPESNDEEWSPGSSAADK